MALDTIALMAFGVGLCLFADRDAPAVACIIGAVALRIVSYLYAPLP